MRKSCVISASLVAFLVAACSQSGSGPNAPTSPTATGATSGGSVAQVSGQGPVNSPLTATIQFGQVSVGSPFAPDPPHDASAHAKDNLVPRTVVIGSGGTVTFNVPAGVHQIAIYEPGTEPEDIDTTDLTSLAAFAGCAGPPFVNAPLVIDVLDDPNLEAAYPVPCFEPTQVEHSFDGPGRYLVICSFLPHFEVQMYGWVVVRE